MKKSKMLVCLVGVGCIVIGVRLISGDTDTAVKVLNLVKTGFDILSTAYKLLSPA